MASAVLANRNEPSWSANRGNGGGGVRGMGKVPFRNPKSKPNMNKRLINGEFNGYQMDDATQAASDNASSFNHYRESPFNQYVSFNIASFSDKDLLGLKKRLVAELEQVRVFKNRIESSGVNHGVNHLKKSSKATGMKRARSSSFGKPLPISNSEIGNLFKVCSQILTKLMKQKFGSVFNKPVDAVGLNLHDYHDIIRHPMDLGTVKSKLANNLYASPLDFAEDVRLTFNNAMKYNPVGHDIHLLSAQWLSKFEDLFRPVSEKLGELKQPDPYDEEIQASSWNHAELEKVSDQENLNLNLKTVEELRVPSGSPKPPSVQSPVKTPSPVRQPPLKPARQPKPKAKDPNKREMSLEEKHMLGMGLQSLPQEKMEQVVQIVKRRNGNLMQDGDEIELDIEVIDTETLWELDRLVTNWKKMMSKMKRQELSNDNVNAAANEMSSAFEKNETKKPRKGDIGEEDDVDIGDEMPVSGFPPVEIDRDAGGGHVSSSSSSSSSSGSDDSSSSSDSDSEGSSSGSDSDNDAQS